MSDVRDGLAALVRVLRARRDELLAAWRYRVHADPVLARGGGLPPALLDDDVPQLLDEWERRLLDPARREPEGQAAADGSAHADPCGPNGVDVVSWLKALGWLNECVLAEIDRHAALHPDEPGAVHAVARQLWARVHGAAVCGSVGPPARLQAFAGGTPPA